MASVRETYYTLRWCAKKIKLLSEDPKVDGLADDMIEMLSKLLGEAIPEDVKPPEPPRPDTAPPATTQPVLGIYNEKRLWYPKAIQVPKMKAQGTYAKNYPAGCVVHFTAGRYELGFDNAKSSCAYGATQGYLYMCMGTDGKIAQPNNMSEHGYHAGESKWVINGTKVSGVSNRLMGMEINNPGRLTLKNGKYYTYYDTGFKNPIDAKNVRIIKANDDNILAGAYLPFTKEQEAALIEFLCWAKYNNPDVFSFDNVVGHDECAGPKGLGHWRKNDPGGALSMNMTKFRALLKVEYAKRYNKLG